MAIILDRTQVKAKNAGNVERFVKRHENVIREAIAKEFLNKDIKDPKIVDINIPITERELSITHTNTNLDHIFIGNRKYRRGDRIPKQKLGQGGGGGDGSSDEKPPSVIVTAEDLEKYLFSECELPNWIDKENPTIVDYKQIHAGFKRSGLPGNIDIRRSIKNGIGRSMALVEMYDAEIEEQEKYLDTMPTQEDLTKQIQLIAELKQERDAILFLDDVDLRYKHKELLPNYISKGVIFLCLDVSGSMTEKRLEVSKLFFILTVLFIRRFYDSIEVVFIKFANTARVCTEKEFYDNDFTGGTVLSTPLIKVKELIETKYNPNEYNIFIVQASDTENFDHDTETFIKYCAELSSLVQYFIYVRIGEVSYYNKAIETLILTFAKTRSEKFILKAIENRSEVIKAFIDIFRKKL